MKICGKCSKEGFTGLPRAKNEKSIEATKYSKALIKQHNGSTNIPASYFEFVFLEKAFIGLDGL